MAILLHRFPLSHFSEKARATLDFKELEYGLVEHRLGLPQIGIYRLSGQRQVPVIEHDGTIVSDSTRIALYLEEAFPERRRLLPADASARRDVRELEDRIDRVIGAAAPVVWFASLLEEHPDEAARVLSIEVYGVGLRMSRVLSGALARLSGSKGFQSRVNSADQSLRRLLLELCDRLSEHRFLIGNEPSLADVAAAGLALHLKFPESIHLGVPDFAGRGVSSYVDDPKLGRFFKWRDEFYREFLK
jgi:glutathione S-transferase